MTENSFEKIVQEIRLHHAKIIEDWCKAYLAELYEKGADIKPGCFTLIEQELTYNEDTKSMCKKYWFQRRNDNETV